MLLKELRVAAATLKILFIRGGSKLWGGECRARPLFPEAQWGQASWAASGRVLDRAHSQDYSPRLPPPGQGVQWPHLRPQAGKTGAVRPHGRHHGG